MACLERWAEAWDYAVWWQCAGLDVGYDDSGGAANAFLTDSTVLFTASGLNVQTGAPVYNATTSTYGVITAVADHVLQVQTATWSNGDEYQIVNMTGSERATIEAYLRIAASDINVALRATGACDCSLAADAVIYLQKLNVIEALIWHNCPCGRPQGVTPEQRASYLLWIQNEMNNLRSGAVELCSGYTGSEWPAIASAEQSWTNWRAAEIIINAQRRKP